FARAGFSGAGASALGLPARGANSNRTFPSGPRTRNAENGRPLREMKRCSRSVFPVASSFSTCSRSIGRCRMMRPERKSQRRPDSVLADIGHRLLEYAAAALWAGAQRRLPGKVDLLLRAVAAGLSEIELRAEFRRQLHHGGERLAHAAAEALERADRALRDQ